MSTLGLNSWPCHFSTIKHKPSTQSTLWRPRKVRRSAQHSTQDCPQLACPQTEFGIEWHQVQDIIWPFLRINFLLHFTFHLCFLFIRTYCTQQKMERQINPMTYLLLILPKPWKEGEPAANNQKEKSLTGAFLSIGLMTNFLSLKEIFLISLQGKPILGVSL